jgi:hypothetical protein
LKPNFFPKIVVQNVAKICQINSCHPPPEKKRRVWEEVWGSQ